VYLFRRQQRIRYWRGFAASGDLDADNAGGGTVNIELSNASGGMDGGGGGLGPGGDIFLARVTSHSTTSTFSGSRVVGGNGSGDDAGVDGGGLGGNGSIGGFPGSGGDGGFLGKADDHRAWTQI
jgi:hypothetical protein